MYGLTMKFFFSKICNETFLKDIIKYLLLSSELLYPLSWFCYLFHWPTREKKCGLHWTVTCTITVSNEEYFVCACPDVVMYYLHSYLTHTDTHVCMHKISSSMVFQVCGLCIFILCMVKSFSSSKNSFLYNLL